MPAMRTPPRIMFLLLLPALLAGCATQPPQSTAGATFIVIRHAEKVLGDSKDPPLTATGQARAEALVASLSREPLEAAYATAFRRTQQTATPSARSHQLPIITYDAKLPATQFAEQLKQAHTTGTVLVVGHSNTVPDIAAALCVCTVPRMDDTEYDRRMIIHVAPNGAPRLTITRDP
ncbi:MAG: histidine phosphatase family protein [Pseudomonadota bacterium]|nr:histidine phosphatase family protein [Pseudomonadota bacterium]